MESEGQKEWETWVEENFKVTKELEIAFREWFPGQATLIKKDLKELVEKDKKFTIEMEKEEEEEENKNKVKNMSLAEIMNLKKKKTKKIVITKNVKEL